MCRRHSLTSLHQRGSSSRQIGQRVRQQPAERICRGGRKLVVRDLVSWHNQVRQLATTRSWLLFDSGSSLQVDSEVDVILALVEALQLLCIRGGGLLPRHRSTLYSMPDVAHLTVYRPRTCNSLITSTTGTTHTFPTSSTLHKPHLP